MQTETDHQKKITAIEMHVLTDSRRELGDVRVLTSKKGGYSLRATQDPMDLYYRRRMLGDEETGYERYAAGRRLYRDFYVSGQEAMLTIDLNRVRSPDKRVFMPSTERQRIALDEYRKAIDAVHGVIGKLMVINVCCYGYFLKDIQCRYYKNSEHALPRFQEALDDLAAFYFKS